MKYYPDEALSDDQIDRNGRATQMFEITIEHMSGKVILGPKNNILYKAGVRPDVIVFNPIRAGCKEEVLTSAADMEPKRIVYVSCNPATMARDIEILTHYGYELKEVQPVDMFPMIAHVEAVALLTRSEVTQRVIALPM